MHVVPSKVLHSLPIFFNGQSLGFDDSKEMIVLETNTTQRKLAPFTASSEVSGVLVKWIQ